VVANDAFDAPSQSFGLCNRRLKASRPATITLVHRPAGDVDESTLGGEFNGNASTYAAGGSGYDRGHSI
jgi:hypothetical protein